MSRKVRDIIPTISTELKPRQIPLEVVVKDIARRRARSKMYYNRKGSESRPLKEFSYGEKVFVKPNPSNKHKPWLFGEVIDKPAPRSCVVQTAKGEVRRNHRQIRRAMVEPEPMNQTETIVHDDEISDPFVSSKRIPETESQPHIEMELPSSLYSDRKDQKRQLLRQRTENSISVVQEGIEERQLSSRTLNYS